VTEETPEWTIDYDAIIAGHLARRPSRVWPGLGFAIPMSKEEWWGFPRMPGWKYKYNVVSKQWHLAFGVTEELRYYARRPLFYWMRNELWRREYLEETRGIPLEPLERAKLERWFMALADELDALEREDPWFDRRAAGRRLYREEASRYLVRKEKA